ncbi:hypothetical protein RDp07_gp05 [Roseobacter phage RD-1410Ws-07]|uniref:Uncharacterized protein n=2 Tax=Sanyabayvirus DS1410Ws06 TaxID=2844087 RepID=A0A191VYN0_9CAUD|nr:hypothetical protein HYO98_gp08 [Dinoroseobacter phage DS-1410Ws-06]ANJ20665.1 hypothetical protein DSp06_gp08 [Dinoroseobacter phage DS-1410Ws-06]ANJ20816.1 hypothetical protein RDp07_gp05 [Roseobacter phage RD-1410Ws-07]
MAFTIKTNKTNKTNAASDEDEFAGLWINFGPEIEVGDEGETKLARLPRGVAVSDLKDHKIYASTNPEWAEEAKTVNAVMAMIRKKGLSLEEGESVNLNLTVQLYRRQEQVEQVVSDVNEADLEAQLFG